MGSMVGATICVYCGRSDGECDRVEVQIPEHHGRGICTITLCGRCDTSTGFTETLDGLTIRHRCGWHHVPGSRCLCKPDIERCDVPPSEPAPGQDAPNSSRGSAVEPRTGAEGTSVTPQPSAGLYGENGPEVLTEAERALCADGARLSGAATPGPWEPLFKGVTLDGGSWHIGYGDDDEALRCWAQIESDAAFVAWSREGVPELLALVERLEAEVDILRHESRAELMHKGEAECPVCDHLTIEEVCRWNEELEAERGRARDHAALLEADGARLRERVAALADEMQNGRLIPGTPVFGCAACGLPELCKDHDEGLQHAGDMLRALLAEPTEGGE